MQLTTTSTTKTTTKTPAIVEAKAPRITKLSLVIAIFNNLLASSKPDLTCNIQAAAFRKKVLTQAMIDCECSLASAAAMYNKAKIGAVKNGLTNDFSKSARKASAAKAAEVAAEAEKLALAKKKATSKSAKKSTAKKATVKK